MCFSSGPASGWGRPCLWSACVRLVAQHRPQRLFTPSPAPRSPPPAASPWAGLRGPGEQARALELVAGLASAPQVFFPPASPPGPGAVRRWERGGWRQAAGAAGAAVWYSHYQPPRGPARPPLGHGGCLHTSCCLLTQGRLLQGRRCRLGNQGVQGPPKQPGSRSPQKPQKALRG